jgi:hypothetical protein
VKRVLLSSCLVAVVVAAWSAVAHPWGWLYAIGVHPYPGPQTPWTYQLWSGFMPALTVLSLLGALASVYHLHNCHADRCWRIGKQRVNGLPWCKRHASDVRPELSDNQLLQQILTELSLLRDALKSR